MFHVVFRILSLIIYLLAVADRLHRLGKRELIFVLVIMWFLLGGGPLPLCTLDRLHVRYFIVALFGPSI